MKTERTIYNLIEAIDAAWATVTDEKERLELKLDFYKARAFANRLARKAGLEVADRRGKKAA